ncbi:hypothetical protein C8R47DRAFT_959834, partial [Mycena vitilis]
YREDFLVEVVRGEGRGDHRECTVCVSCEKGPAEYRCKDCLGGDELLCKPCIVEQHSRTPLHCIEFWTGQTFEKKTLKQLGLRIQLGHWNPGNPRCSAPESAVGNDFVIVDERAIHEVAVHFCGCGGGSRARQLLRARLYPATGAAPRTAATFSVLRKFHLLSLEAKCSVYHFYHSLARGTNNTGLDPPDRYHEFARMTREWRNLRMLIRAGRAHDPTGAAGTGSGECAELCPACPQPGKNMPEKWEDIPEDRRFLHALFLAIDANFRLKRKDISSEEADPGLAPGWAFFCEISGFMSHLAKNWDIPQERSTCVAHDAVDKPDREARGTASSGVGTVDCARHNMKRPNGVGDLQFGERYINMDYMFFKSLEGTKLQRFFVSYDIACQWHKNIWVRMSQYDAEIQFVDDRKFMTWLVPKWHLPAHIEACNVRFSFNLTRDVGQTDGEAPERGWANANPLATSTKEMGPGARRDALDDHWNDWNYKKIIAFGRVMLKKMTEAVPQMVEKAAALVHIESTLEVASRDVEEGPVAEWTAMAELWEENPDEPNPFEIKNRNDHLAKVRHDLAVEAAAREAAGKALDGAADCFFARIALGFDASATGLHPTHNQRTAMVERTGKLRRKIVSWIDIQHAFFPEVKVLRDKEDEARARIARTQAVPGLQVHELRLWLPSEMMKRPGAKQGMTPLQREAVEHEYRLRVGQGNETLDEIRGQLLVRTHLYKHKDANVRGVRESTRSSTKIQLIDDRVRRLAAQYRTGRRALQVLGPILGRMEWETVLRPLEADDIRGMPRSTFGDPLRQRGATGKPPKRKKKKVAEPTMSWIWIVQVDPGNPAAVNEALRIEWARIRARAHRWAEEVDLLEEEMCRIDRFLAWKSAWWLERADGRRREEDSAEREGERAYAYRQAKLKADLRDHFAGMWAELPELARKGRAGELHVVCAPGGAPVVSTAPRLPAAVATEEVGTDESSEEEESEEEANDGARAVPLSAVVPVAPSYLQE